MSSPHLLQLLRQAGVQIPASIAEEDPNTLLKFVEKELAKKAHTDQENTAAQTTTRLDAPAAPAQISSSRRSSSSRTGSSGSCSSDVSSEQAAVDASRLTVIDRLQRIPRKSLVMEHPINFEELAKDSGDPQMSPLCLPQNLSPPLSPMLDKSKHVRRISASAISFPPLDQLRNITLHKDKLTCIQDNSCSEEEDSASSPGTSKQMDDAPELPQTNVNGGVNLDQVVRDALKEIYDKAVAQHEKQIEDAQFGSVYNKLATSDHWSKSSKKRTMRDLEHFIHVIKDDFDFEYGNRVSKTFSKAFTSRFDCALCQMANCS